jgi:hypothetical protein
VQNPGEQTYRKTIQEPIPHTINNPFLVILTAEKSRKAYGYTVRMLD